MNYSQNNNNKRLRKHKSHGKKVKNKVGFVFFRVFVAGFLIGSFALSAIGLGAYLSIIHASPPLTYLSFDLLEGDFDSVVFDAHGNELVRLEGGVNRVFAEWDEIPEHLWQAFVAIEDERFFEHNGVDAQGMVRAVYQTLLHGNTQGASTITQQLVKNQLGVRRNTIETKLQEQYLAIQFEAMLVEELGSVEAAKQRILHLYLNEIYLGGGNRGVQAASWFYFNKGVDELTLSESAVIAAITQWPYLHNPLRHPEYNRLRQLHVLDSMLRLGFITEAEHRAAVNDDPFSRIQQVAAEIHPDGVIWHYFVDAVIERLEQDFLAMGLTREQAHLRIFHGGLEIHTTMDPRVQGILDEVFMNEDHFPTNPQDFEYHLRYVATIRNETTGQLANRERQSTQWGRRVTNRDMFDEFIEWAQNSIMGMDDYIVSDVFFFTPQPQSSMVILDHSNGHVLGIAGQRGEKQANRAFCRATAAARQPGSVFKMFASYAPAFDTGLITAATTYDDAPNIIREGNRSRVWPTNWNHAFRGYSSVRHAIEQSMNVVAVRNINAVGTRTAHNYLLNFGFTTIGADEMDNPSMALGGLTHGVTNLELTGAMGAIANGGILHPPILYTHVLDVNGNIVIDNTTLSPTQVLNRNSAYLLIDTMRGVVTRGTGTGARFQNLPGMDNAGKTGTTQEVRDIYYTGSTPHLTASVWVGHDVPRTMTPHVTGGGNRRDVRIWRYVMERVHIELELEPLTFERPPGFFHASVCGVSGGAPVAGLCDADPRGSMIRRELFAPGTTAHMVPCHVHIAFEVCAVSGMLPSPWCPPEHRVRRVGIHRDRSWMEAAGNITIQDAGAETPREVCNVHDASTPVWDDENGPPSIDDEGFLEWLENWLAQQEAEAADDTGPGGLFIPDDEDDAGVGPQPTPVTGDAYTPTQQPAPTPTATPTATAMPDRTPIALPEATAPPLIPEPTPTAAQTTQDTAPTIGAPGGN